MYKYAFILLITASTLLLSCVTPSPSPQQARIIKASRFQNSVEWNKLDGRLKQAWLTAYQENDLARSFEIMIKTDGKISDNKNRVLFVNGFMTRSTIGSIATGTVRAGDVPKVAKIEFVKVMELAIPMSIKRR